MTCVCYSMRGIEDKETTLRAKRWNACTYYVSDQSITSSMWEIWEHKERLESLKQRTNLITQDKQWPLLMTWWEKKPSLVKADPKSSVKQDFQGCQCFTLEANALWVEWQWKRRIKHSYWAIHSSSRTFSCSHWFSLHYSLRSFARSLNYSHPNVWDRGAWLWIKCVDFIPF